MKRLHVLGLVCLFSCCLQAQVVDSTVCDILKDPASFNGKIVRIKATVTAGYDQFVVKGPGCGHKINDIWFSYPEGTKGKAGPALMLQLQPAQNYAGTVAAPARTPVTLEKSKDFKQFDSLLAAQAKVSAMCLGCPRYEVSATLVGRIDGVETALHRDKAGKVDNLSGFGNINAYKARLVLQSVSDVTPKEIDYSKAIAAAKGDLGLAPNASPDPIEINRQAIKAFGVGTAGGNQLSRAIDALIKVGEKSGVNGVFILNTTMNEAADKNEAKGTKTSPDGILFNCAINSNRLSADGLVRATAYMGEIVADLRSPQAGSEEEGIYELQFHGWSTTLLDVLASGQKTLTLPGGTLLWDSTWPGAERNTHLDAAIKGFLGDEELLSR